MYDNRDYDTYYGDRDDESKDDSHNASDDDSDNVSDCEDGEKTFLFDNCSEQPIYTRSVVCTCMVLCIVVVVTTQ